MKDSILNKKKYRGIPIWEQGTSYALCSAIADNIHILKKDMYGNYCIANETKIKGVTIEDLAFYYAIGRAYALGFCTEIKHKFGPTSSLKMVLLHCIRNPAGHIPTSLMI